MQQAVERRKTASIEPFELDFDDIHEDDGLQAVCRMRFVSVVADSLSCVDHCGPMSWEAGKLLETASCFIWPCSTEVLNSANIEYIK